MTTVMLIFFKKLGAFRLKDNSEFPYFEEIINVFTDLLIWVNSMKKILPVRINYVMQ